MHTHLKKAKTPTESIISLPEKDDRTLAIVVLAGHGHLWAPGLPWAWWRSANKLIRQEEERQKARERGE